MIRAMILAAAVAISASAAYASEAAERVIETAAERLVEGRLDSQSLTETLDAPRIARFALGRHARTVEADELDAYTEAFETFLVDTFDEHSGRFRGADVDVIGSTDRNARDSVVTTRVAVANGEPSIIRWRLLERGGEWRIVDVEVAGLWLAIEQRAQIQSILARRNATLDDVVDSLNG